MIRLKTFLKEAKTKKVLPPAITVWEFPTHGGHSKEPGVVQEETGLPHVNQWTHTQPSYDEQEARLHAHYDFPGLNKDDKKPLNDYSFSSYDTNHALINMHKDPDKIHHQEAYEMKKNHIDDLDGILGKYKTPENLVVYHGAGFDPDEYASLHPDRQITSPAFFSTSLDRLTAHPFSRSTKWLIGDEWKNHLPHTDDSRVAAVQQNVLSIKIPKGSPGFHIGKYGSFAHEHEFLMPRNSVLRIAKEPIKFNSNTYSDHLGKDIPVIHNIWDAEYLGSK